MKLTILTLVLSLFVLTTLVVADDFKGMVDVEVYFNNQTATVDNATLKIGEPFTVKAVIKLKKDVFTSAKLSAAGFKDGEPQPYEVVDGPSKFTEIADDLLAGKDTVVPENVIHKTGQTIEWEWKLKPTNVWSGGTAPIDIDFSFYDIEKAKGYPLSFTVANIYISNEPYTSGAAAPSQPEMSVFSIVKTPLAQTSTASVTQKQPGFEISFALAALLSLAYVLRGKKRRTK